MIPPSANDEGEDQISKSIAEKLKELDATPAPDRISAVDTEERIARAPPEDRHLRHREFGLSVMMVSIFVLIVSSLIYSFDRLQGSMWFVYAWFLLGLGAWYRDKGRPWPASN